MSKIVELAAAVPQNLEDVLINIGKIRKEHSTALLLILESVCFYLSRFQSLDFDIS